MTKAEQAFLGVSLVALVAIFVYHYQRPVPGTGSVVGVDPNLTGLGDPNNGPAYLVSNAPWALQPWNGGAVIPMSTAGTQNMNSDVLAMDNGTGGCGSCG